MISSITNADLVSMSSSSRNLASEMANIDVDESDSHSDESDDDEVSYSDPFLEELENIVRAHVFNKMPIRLLLLPEMKLIERGAVVRHIMNTIPVKSGAEFDTFLIAESEKDPIFLGEEFDYRPYVIEILVQRYARYAILSHTWLQKKPEVVFEDAKDAQRWTAIQSRRGAAYRKLESFCNVAREEFGVSLAWMDTICINKDSTSELEESIRSMYRWYNLSYICIVYLANTTSLADMHLDRWFTRGWTLQELLAPEKVKFYNKVWDNLTTSKNDKTLPSMFESSEVNGEQISILQIIHEVTGIQGKELMDFQPGVDQGIASRMVWAAKRITTRGEDRAYSLMGVFNVSFSIAYGEGADRAFFRLLEAILVSFNNPLDTLNWAGSPSSSKIHACRILPSNPESYLNHSPGLQLSSVIPMQPMILTHIGLEVKLLVMYANPVFHRVSTLPNPPKIWKPHHFESRPNPSFVPRSPINISLPDIYMTSAFANSAFVLGIFGFQETLISVTIPATCPAVLLWFPDYNFSGNWEWTSPKSTVKDLLSKTTLRPFSKADTERPILLSLTSSNSLMPLENKLITRHKSTVLDDNTVCISAYL